jgi:hypothetical protein
MSKKLLGILAAVGILVLPVLASGPESGLKVGETVTPFHPSHVTGPLKGTNNCPPCTFGSRPQVQVWVNGDNMKNVVEISKVLDKKMKANSEFKAFVVVLTDKPEETAKFLAALAERAGLKDVALTYLSNTDNAIRNYKVSVAEDVKNTVFVYKNKQVSEKFVNLKADEQGLDSLSKAIAKVEG